MSRSAAIRLSTEARQSEIVRAALAIAAGRSPASITSAELAAAVGISQGAVFKHFPSKDAIWLAAMRWIRAQLQAALEAAAATPGTGAERLEAVFLAHVAFVEANPGAPRIIFHELAQGTDSPVRRQAGLLMKAYRQLLIGLIGEAARRGEILAGTNAEAAATLFIGIVQGLVMQSMIAGPASRLGPRARPAFALYLRALEPR